LQVDLAALHFCDLLGREGIIRLVDAEHLRDLILFRLRQLADLSHRCLKAFRHGSHPTLPLTG